MINQYTNYLRTDYLTGIACLIVAFILGVLLTEYSTKTIIIAILAIFGAGISIYRPSIPLFLFFLFMGMNQLAFIPNQSVMKVFGLFFVALVCVQIAVTKKISFPRGSKSIWILVFGVVAILSLFVSYDPSESQKRLIRLWRLIPMYFFIVFFISNIRTLNRAQLFLIIGGALSIMLNLMLEIGKRGFDPTIGDLRSSGLVGDPNEFAVIILVLMPLSLLMFFRSKGSLKKAISLGLFAVLLIGFFGTFSRGGFLGFSVMLMFSMFKFNILNKRSNKVKVFAYIMILAIMGMAVFYPLSERYVARIETLGASPTSQDAARSVSGRYELYTTALNVFLDHPILGVGMRSFHALNPRGKVAHNTYLEVLSGMGLLGFIPFMTILLLSWRELKRIQNFWKLRGKESSLTYQSAAALELGFAGYFVAATFVSLDIHEMTWLLITFSSVLWKISLNEKETGSYYEKRDTHPFRHPDTIWG